MASDTKTSQNKKVALQFGITGMPLNQESTVLASEVNWEQFRQICFIAARNYGGKFIHLSKGFTDNYRAAWFSHKQDPAKRIVGMINEYFPLMGFLLIDGRDFDSLDENGIPKRMVFGGWSFREYPIFEDSDLTYWFTPSYRILNREELCEPLHFEVTTRPMGKGKKQHIVTLKNEHSLRSEEIQDLYNNQSRISMVAEAIFNYFD